MKFKRRLNENESRDYFISVAEKSVEMQQKELRREIITKFGEFTRPNLGTALECLVNCIKTVIDDEIYATAKHDLDDDEVDIDNLTDIVIERVRRDFKQEAKIFMEIGITKKFFDEVIDWIPKYIKVSYKNYL